MNKEERLTKKQLKIMMEDNEKIDEEFGIASAPRCAYCREKYAEPEDRDT
jgi:hypothetical protein